MFQTPRKRLRYDSAVSARPTKSARARISRPIRWKSTSVGSLQRAIFLDIAVLNGVGAGYGLSFQSGGVNLNGAFSAFSSGGGDLSALYDAYRITKVQLTFAYNQNAANPNQNATDLPYIFIVNDYDDVSTNTTQDILQRDAVQMYTLGGNGPYGNHIKWGCVPKVAQAAYASVATTGYLEPKTKQWVSTGGFTSFNDVQHYGVKFFIDASAQTQITGTNGNLRVFIKVFYEGKHAR